MECTGSGCEAGRDRVGAARWMFLPWVQQRQPLLFKLTTSHPAGSRTAATSGHGGPCGAAGSVGGVAKGGWGGETGPSEGLDTRSSSWLFNPDVNRRADHNLSHAHAMRYQPHLKPRLEVLVHILLHSAIAVRLQHLPDSLLAHAVCGSKFEWGGRWWAGQWLRACRAQRQGAWHQRRGIAAQLHAIRQAGNSDVRIPSMGPSAYCQPPASHPPSGLPPSASLVNKKLTRRGAICLGFVRSTQLVGREEGQARSTSGAPLPHGTRSRWNDGSQPQTAPLACAPARPCNCQSSAAHNPLTTHSQPNLLHPRERTPGSCGTRAARCGSGAPSRPPPPPSAPARTAAGMDGTQND